MEIMLEINDRMLQSPKPDYEPYLRPEGAYLVGESTSTLNSLNETDVTFYPNPVTYELTITRTTADINHIQLISVFGSKVIDRDWDSSSLTTQLDLSNLNAGVYFLNVSNVNSHSISRKILINK